jgi:hypothetical protein
MAENETGTERAVLLGTFSKIVSPGDRDRWDRRFIGLVEDSGAERKSFVLELMRADASTFSVYVDCQRRDAGDSAPTLRLALVDISNIREAEEERRSAVGATKPR